MEQQRREKHEIDQFFQIAPERFLQSRPLTNTPAKQDQGEDRQDDKGDGHGID
jgi:hypothetical protein